jgi:hypothetical protein
MSKSTLDGTKSRSCATFHSADSFADIFANNANYISFGTPVDVISLGTPVDIRSFNTLGTRVDVIQITTAVSNVNKFAIICKTVNSFFVNGFPKIGTEELPFEQVSFLREYQKLPSHLVSYMQRHGMVSTATVDLFINKNFFELETIAHSLEGSGLLNQLHGIYDPIAEICSYLKLDDVNLCGNDQSDTI